MTAGRVRLPIGLFGAIALVVGFEAAVEWRELDTVSVDAWQYRFASRTATAEAVGCEILAFGDSLLKYSFLPAVLERRQGLRSYNLAVCGGRAPYHYYLLRRVLEGGARPSVVLLEFFPSSLSTGPRLNAEALPHFLRASECLDLGLSARDTGLLGELLAGWLLPSVRCRQAIRADIVNWVQRKPGGARFEYTWLLPWWSKNRGAQAMHSQPAATGDVRLLQHVAFPASWSSDPVNDLYVDRFLDLARRHGAAVYWVLTPLSPALQAECERSGFDVRYAAYVQSWQQRFPNLKVIDVRHSEYDPDVYSSDPAHLGRDGAFVFSVDIGEFLRRTGSEADSAAERWVTLPRFRRLTPDVDIEDDLTARRSASAGGKGFVKRF